jgi:uncharacterized OB-fold protein
MGTPELWENHLEAEMFRCERCGSAFSPIRVTADQTCPRCRAREGVSAPLTFVPFTATDTEVDGSEIERPAEAPGAEDAEQPG